MLGFNATLTSSSASDAGVGVGATGVGVCDDIERIISVAGGGSGGGGTAMAAALTAAAASKRQQQFDALAAAARVSPSARAAVERLAADPRNVVVIFSGSDRAKLDDAFGCQSSRVWLAAENGVFVKPPGRDWAALIEPPKKEWMDAVQTVFDYFCERTPRSYVEARATSVVWNYKHADAEFGRLQARDLLQHLWTGPISNARVDIVQGSRSVEVRPVGVSKGLCMQRIVGAMAEEAAAAGAAAAAAAAAAKVAAEVEASERRGDTNGSNGDGSSPPPSSSPSPSAEEAAATARAAASAAAAAGEPFDFVLVAGHFLARDENIFTFFEGRLPSEADGGADGLASFPPRAGSGTENGGVAGGGWQCGGLPGDIGGVFAGVGVAGYGQFPPATQQLQQQQQQQQQAASNSEAAANASSDSYSAGHSLRGGPGMPPRSPQRSSAAAAAAAPVAGGGSASPSQLHPLPESPNEGEDGGVEGGYSDNGKPPSSPLPVPRSKQAYVPGEAAAAALAAEAAAAVAAARGGASNASSPTPPATHEAAPAANAPMPSVSPGPPFATAGGAGAGVGYHGTAAAGTSATGGAATPPMPPSADWAGAALLPLLPPASLFTLTVGRKRSQARYFLSGSADVAELLMSVAEATAGK